MALNRKYRPGVDPKPKVWFRGYVSQAQRRHFQGAPELAIYTAGMDYHTPPRGNPSGRKGKLSIKNKMAQLPRRVRGSRKRR